MYAEPRERKKLDKQDETRTLIVHFENLGLKARVNLGDEMTVTMWTQAETGERDSFKWHSRDRSDKH